MKSIKNQLLIIIFSFNRAIQLDCLLRSLIKNLTSVNYSIAIVYHYSGKHKKGYEKLEKKYHDFNTIVFYKRAKEYSFITNTLPLLFHNRNIYRYLKHKFLRSNLDNFKILTESLILNSGCNFTMFLTDDGYFYDQVKIPEDIFEKIAEDPYQVSYRMYVGRNLKDCPVLNEEDNLLRWNYYDPAMYSHWAYPFAVDATIYQSEALLNIIKPVFYHMPSTLESFVVTHCNTRKLLGKGYSPLRSNYIGLFINRVSPVGDNYSGSISVDMLNDRWLEGYELDYLFPIPPDQQSLIPTEIKLKHPYKEDIIL
jgi:hypothetical protein